MTGVQTCALPIFFNFINEDYFEELENILIMSDVGVSMVMKIVDEIKNEVRIQNITEPFIKPREAMVVTQIVEGIYESARTGKEVFFE